MNASWMIALDALEVQYDHLHEQPESALYVYVLSENAAFLSWIVSHIEYDDRIATVVLDANSGDIITIFDEHWTADRIACGNGGNVKSGIIQYCRDTTLNPLRINDAVYPVMANARIRVFDNRRNDVTNLGAAVPVQCLPQSTNTPYCDVQDYSVNGAGCPAVKSIFKCIALSAYNTMQCTVWTT